MQIGQFAKKMRVVEERKQKLLLENQIVAFQLTVFIEFPYFSRNPAYGISRTDYGRTFIDGDLLPAFHNQHDTVKVFTQYGRPFDVTFHVIDRYDIHKQLRTIFSFDKLVYRY